MPSIVGVFDGFGGADIHGMDLGSVAAVDLPQHLAGAFVQSADHRDRGLPEIVDRASFAQKLGVVGKPEVHAGLLPGNLTQHRNHITVGRAGQNRAADNQHVIFTLEGEGASNVFASLKNIAEIEIAVVEARRSDADEARLCCLYRLARIRGGSQPLGTNGLLNEFWYARLADRRFPRVDGSYLLGRYVDGDDLVAILDHTCSQDG